MENEIKNFYDINELKIIEYEYKYIFKYCDNYSDKNEVTVLGKRTGIACSFDEDNYYDLIAGSLIAKDAVSSLKQFSVEYFSVSVEQIKTIFRELEDANGYTACEYVSSHPFNHGDLYFCVPYVNEMVEFKASETKLGVVEEFNKNVEYKKNKEPQCELDRIVQKIKNKFRRK